MTCAGPSRDGDTECKSSVAVFVSERLHYNTLPKTTRPVNGSWL